MPYCEKHKYKVFYVGNKCHVCEDEQRRKSKNEEKERQRISEKQETPMEIFQRKTTKRIFHLICDSVGWESSIRGYYNVATRSEILIDKSYLSLILIEEIDAEAIRWPYCLTVIEAWHQLQQVKLKPDDIVIFNIGVNDCVYRKDKKVQFDLFLKWLKNAEERNDIIAINLYKEKIDYVRNKPDNELFQVLIFKDFEKYLDMIFGRVGSQGIALSINWFSKNQSYIGWAYNECEKASGILKVKAEQYGLSYVDLWTDHKDRTCDGVHFTSEGHKYVANKIMGILNQKKAEIVK